MHTAGDASDARHEWRRTSSTSARQEEYECLARLEAHTRDDQRRRRGACARFEAAEFAVRGGCRSSATTNASIVIRFIIVVDGASSIHSGRAQCVVIIEGRELAKDGSRDGINAREGENDRAAIILRV